MEHGNRHETDNTHKLVAPADDPTPTPLGPGPHPLGDLTPWLECISKSPGAITAYFGFDNPTMDDIGVPVGANNQFVPNPPVRLLAFYRTLLRSVLLGLTI